ncbi:MAG: hypothetical protein ACTHJ1_03800 [Bordetella sp.]|uniref:hypothetical protein n=1 Tax=Bordetella sp. TaxID=28081 RepID=UPI003F7C4581
MKRISQDLFSACLGALLLCCCLPAVVLAAPAAQEVVPPDAVQWQPQSDAAVNITGSLAFEMAHGTGEGGAAKMPVAMRFDRLGRVPVRYIGAFDAATVAPATVWVVSVNKPDVALSCGANPVKAFVIETEPSAEGGRLNLYGLDQDMTSVPNIKNLPAACFLAVYLRR